MTRGYQYLLFDLDGTLTDPGLGITNSVMYALEKFGIHTEDRTALYRFIGPPLTESFETFYGFTAEQSALAVTYYREYFKSRGMYENEVYNGIPALLAELKAQGKTLIVATSKPEAFAAEILRYFALDGYFDLVAGATMDGSRAQKADIIRYAMEAAGITEKAAALMIGDREHDAIGAKANGLDTLGVLYGYGSEAELRAAGAKYLAHEPKEILAFVSH